MICNGEKIEKKRKNNLKYNLAIFCTTFENDYAKKVFSWYIFKCFAPNL